MANNSIKKNNGKTDGKSNGVYLDIKTRLTKISEIFDYSSDDQNKNLNTLITEATYLCIDEYNNIFGYPGLSSIEKLLLIIRPLKKKNKFYIDNFLYKRNPINIENLRKIKNYLWYVINSDSKEIINPNEDYYLGEGDVFKIGRVKYYVKEIFIKEEKGKIENNELKKEIKGGKINNFIPEIKEYKKCDFCNKILFKFCKCEEYQHIDCIKKWIEDRIIIIENKKKTVKNYQLNIYFCDEYISKDPNCIDSECNDCKCVKCNTYYPLKFKYKYFDENNKTEEIKYIDFFPISKPENSNYMILESIEYTDEYKNMPQIIKAIHVIKLTEGDSINIGCDYNNDVIVNHSSVCEKHAIIKNENSKLLLKNKSKLTGTLVLYQKEYFDFSEKEVYFQVDNTFISAKMMKEDEFLLSKKNNETNYPLKQKPKI